MLSLLFSDQAARKDFPPASRALAWADTIAEDPLTGDIWEGVDFGAEERGMVRFQRASPAFAAWVLEGLLVSAEAECRGKVGGGGRGAEGVCGCWS